MLITSTLILWLVLCSHMYSYSNIFLYFCNALASLGITSILGQQIRSNKQLVRLSTQCILFHSLSAFLVLEKVITECFFCQQLRKEKPKIHQEANHKEKSPKNKDPINKKLDKKVSCASGFKISDDKQDVVPIQKIVVPIQKKARVAHEFKRSPEVAVKKEVEKSEILFSFQCSK